MNPFQEKYHQTKGTHCWFCDRRFGVDKCIMKFCGKPLIKTREHIIPKSIMGQNYYRNYIASCSDCNGLKGSNTAKGFADKINGLMQKYNIKGHQMTRLFPLMRERALKLYNKTSYLHKKYDKKR